MADINYSIDKAVQSINLSFYLVLERNKKRFQQIKAHKEKFKGINSDYSHTKEYYDQTNQSSNILNDDSFLKKYQNQKDNSIEVNIFNSTNIDNSIDKEVNISNLDYPTEENENILINDTKVNKRPFTAFKNNLRIKASENVTESYKMALFNENNKIKKFYTEVNGIIKEECEISSIKKIDINNLKEIRKYFKNYNIINNSYNTFRNRKKINSENLNKFKIIKYKRLYKKKKNNNKCVLFLTSNLNKIKNG